MNKQTCRAGSRPFLIHLPKPSTAAGRYAFQAQRASTTDRTDVRSIVGKTLVAFLSRLIVT
ncbi:hypothetical protein AGR1A_Lc30015 [Agrobacterium fabacearum CFBP 5771]|nr:hypothetical protein AGR1A_Lc30015 [Agrobacterium fabacearum CFBP 5771]